MAYLRRCGLGVRSVDTFFCRIVSSASFYFECQGKEGSRPGVGEVLAGVLFEFAKAVVDCIAVDVELRGSCLGGAIVVKPGPEGFQKDGSLFVGEPGETGEGGSGEMVHHLRGADCGGSEQIPVEDGDATVRERAIESDAGQGEGLGSGAQVGVGRADPDAPGGTSRENVGEPV